MCGGGVVVCECGNIENCYGVFFVVSMGSEVGVLVIIVCEVYGVFIGVGVIGVYVLVE